MKIGAIPLWVILGGGTLLSLAAEHAHLFPAPDPVQLVQRVAPAIQAAGERATQVAGRLLPSAGPFRSIGELDLPRLEGYAAPAAMARDGSAIAILSRYPDQLTIFDLRSGRSVAAPDAVSAPGFTSVRPSEPAIAWSRDGAFVWSVTQDLRSGGFRGSGLRPIRIARDGRITQLPPLVSPAGPLDAIHWVGHEGLALAQFGTAGDYYKPEHGDPAPELAMGDAARGRVLDRLALRDLRTIEGHTLPFSAHTAIHWASGVRLPDGRLRALVAMSGPPGRPFLIHWTQGEPPIETPHPKPRGDWTRGVLTSDGRAFLLTRELRPDGTELICEIWSSNCPRMPPPRARTGPLLELRDFASGRVLWSLEATASGFWNNDALAVAPDGRFALVGYPPADDGRPRLGIVRLADGKLVQTLPMPASGDAGFTRDGEAVWTRVGNMVRLYGRD